MEFIIVSSTRCGSTMLSSAFNNCENISSFGECLSFKRLNPSMFTNHKDPMILKIRKWNNDHSLYTWYSMNKPNPKENIKDIAIDLIDEWLDWLFAQDENVTFKLLWNHFDMFPFLVEKINNRNLKIIHLTRDPIGRITSLRNKFAHVAEQTNYELLEETRMEEMDLMNWFPNRLKVSFEELTGNEDTREFPFEVTNRIFEYLELPYQKLRPMIKRTIY